VQGSSNIAVDLRTNTRRGDVERSPTVDIAIRVARFERRITESEVGVAREAIAAGASLRSVAAKVPCAPSTLSVRIRKAEAAEAEACGTSTSVNNDSQTERRGTRHPAAPWLGETGEGGVVEPLDVLREAVKATRNGQPHWPTRLAAIRLLATLRPEEFDRSDTEQEGPSIVLYDLEPGAVPVLHRAREKSEPAVGTTDAHSQTDLPESNAHGFSYELTGGDRVPIGMWSPAIPADSTGIVHIVFHTTNDPEQAQRWRAELSSGHLPHEAVNAS
jgi:hypothetical protein